MFNSIKKDLKKKEIKRDNKPTNFTAVSKDFRAFEQKKRIGFSLGRTGEDVK